MGKKMVVEKQESSTLQGIAKAIDPILMVCWGGGNMLIIIVLCLLTWLFAGAKVQKISIAQVKLLKIWQFPKNEWKKQNFFLLYRKLAENSKILHSNLKNFQEGVQNFTIFAA